MKKNYVLFLVLFALVFGVKAQNCDTVRSINASLHSPTWYDIALNWQAPTLAPPQGVLTWSAEANHDGIGTGGAADFDIAHRFETTDLTAFNGNSLAVVSFIPLINECTYSIRIWLGNNGSGPDTLIIDQLLNNADLTLNVWNDIQLSTPIVIDASQELWIGVRCNTTSGYPAACDAGPQVAGKGNMMYYQGAWDELSNLGSGLNYNWNIKGIIPPQDLGNGIVTGYKILRNSVSIDTVTNLSYLDQVSSAGLYTYDIAALWTSGCTESFNTIQVNMDPDPCESAVTVFPYLCSFDSVLQNNCWSIYDINNDGYTFSIDIVNGYAIYSYNSLSNANDWLESPTFTLTGNQYLAFDYKVANSSWPEKFSVLLVSATDTVTLMPTTQVSNTSYINQVIPLVAYTGDYKIALVAESDTDEYRLYFDNFMINDIPAPTIETNVDTVNFGYWAVGQTSAPAMVVVTGWSLTNDIAVTTAAPFQVSLDGNTFSSSVTIPTTSNFFYYDTLYFTYNPIAAGQHQNTTTLTNPEATQVNITLLGEAIDCQVVTTYPYVCNFNPQTPETVCWTIEDVDNDGIISGEGLFSYMAYSDANPGCAVYFASLDTNIADANDWLISPSFTIGRNMYASFEYLVSQTIDWDLWQYVPVPETFSVWIIPDGSTYEDIATPVIASQTVSNVDFATQYLDLTPYTDQRIQIAIKIETPRATGGYFVIDSFRVDTMPDPILTATPDSLSFTTPVGSVSSVQQVSIEGWSLLTNITATTHRPFEISADGISFDTTATLVFTPIYTNVPLYVRFNAATQGTFTNVIALSSTGATDTVYLTGEALDCPATAVPFTEDFENGIPECWLNVDQDGDGHVWESNELSAHQGTGMAASASYDNDFGALHPENWLITPGIIIPAAGANITWWVAAQDPAYAADFYEVKVSTSGWDIANFNTIFSETLTTDTWQQRYVDLATYANQTIHVAFVHKNSYDEYWMKIDDINVTEGVSIEEQSVAGRVAIYPNPTNEVLNVYAENYQKVDILNFLGQVVYSNQVTDNQFQINVSDLSSGVYFIRLSGENTVTKKFVKE